MFSYALRRLLMLPLVLIATYSTAVLLIMATPGDPFDGDDKNVPAEVIEAKRRAFNYDQPWWQRYFYTWPKRLIWDGDLPAHRYEDWSVVQILRSALPISLQLGMLALTFAVAIGLTVGVISAAGRGRWLDHVSVALCLFGVSLPTFVI